jgi:hypothetical protein
MWLGMPPSMTTETRGEMNMRISDPTGCITMRRGAWRRWRGCCHLPVLALAAASKPAQVTTRSSSKGTRTMEHSTIKDGTQIYYIETRQKELT